MLETFTVITRQTKKNLIIC